MGACCFCACIFKMILGVLNMVLMLFGVLTAAAGGILLSLSDSAVVQDIVRMIVVPVLERLYGDDIVVNAVSGNLKEMMSPISWTLIIIGGTIVVITILGYIGLSLNINLCLVIYASLIGLLICVEILLLSLFFSGGLNKPVERAMVKTIQDHYGDFNDSNIITLSWNLVMLRHNCCGASGYKDFQKNMQRTSDWPKNVSVKISGLDFTTKFDMPVFCCYTYGTFPKLNITDQQCVQETSLKNNKDKGCREAIWREIEGVRTQFLTFSIFALFVQVIILIMIFIIMKENKVFPSS